MIRLLIFVAFIAAACPAAFAGPAPLATPNIADYSFTSGGAPQTDVRVSGVDGQGRAYLGGNFDAVNGVNMPGLARIAPDGTLDTTWIPALPPADVLVPEMVVPDAAGRLVVLHSNAKVYRVDSTNGSAVPLTLVALPSMQQCPEQPRTLAVDPSNSDIYVACYSLTLGSTVGLTITPPAGTYAHVYRIDGTTAIQDPAFDLAINRFASCSPGFYAPVKVSALVHDGAGHLYVGGIFTSPQPGLFRVATPSGTSDTAWRPAAPPPNVQPCLNFWADQLFVASIALSPGDAVYVAGSRGRNASLGRFSTLGAGAADPSWAPPAISQTSFVPVTPLALDPPRNRLYAGAVLTDSNGNPQPYLRAFSTLPGAVPDAAWDPQPNAGPTSMYLDRERNRLVIGGDFSLVGGVARQHVAGLPLTGDTIMADYYQSILGRAPDPSGLQFWPGEVVRITRLGASPNEVYIAMAMLFFSSPEFTATTRTDAQFVDKLYLTFFNRAADSGGRDFWVGQIAAGLTREMVMFAFMFSAEFDSYMSARLDVPSPMRPEVGVVMDFYRGVLGRLPDDGGLRYWVNQFRSAQCSAQTGSALYAAAQSIADAFFNSPEYTQTPASDSAYVSDLYNAFLRRGADASGFNFWVSQLAGGAASREQVRAAFINSPEFNARVQAIAAAGCTTQMP